MAEFEIHRCLGRGGFGEVYRGVMSRGGGIAMDVAIKVLRPDLEPSSQGVQRLRDEGRLLGRLTHPTILRVYDLVVIEGRAALISEYVDGDDLAHVIKTDERPPPRAVFEIVAQVAAALDAAWSWPSVMDDQPLNLVHRDIKPDNIRLDPHGVVKLLDFGIAQASAVEREAETSVNIIMGSAQYLAPERMVQQEVGPESDVFALGCTLYEALTGEALFFRKSMRQMYLLMIDEVRYWPFIDERLAALEGVLDHDRAMALLRSMVAYKKTDRPTAGEAAARCDAISESLSGATLRRWARAHSWPAAVAEEPGPLEGRTFTSVMSLPAPEARTLALRTEEDWQLPDPADTLTDPGSREPVLGEKTARAGLQGDDLQAPWSGAELVALDAQAKAPGAAATAAGATEPAADPDGLRPAPPQHEPEGVAEDAPTMQVRLTSRAALEAAVHNTQPRFELDDDEPTITPEGADRLLGRPEASPASPAPAPSVAVPPVAAPPVAAPSIAPPSEDEQGNSDTGPTDESALAEADAALGDTLVTGVTAADVKRARASQGHDAPVEAPMPAAADHKAPDLTTTDEDVAGNAPRGAARFDDDDDYEPQPGDIDLSDTYGARSTGDVQLRVAPPGAELPAIKSGRRRAPPQNRVPVMLFSGAMGVLVGAVVISLLSFLVWLVAG